MKIDQVILNIFFHKSRFLLINRFLWRLSKFTHEWNIIYLNLFYEYTEFHNSNFNNKYFSNI